MEARSVELPRKPIMKLSVLALDYDGTIAAHDTLEPPIRAAIAAARASGIAILLVTGRTVRDLRRVAGSLHLFDGIVAENGGVLHFPATDYTSALAPRIPPLFVDELRRHGIPHTVGQSLVDADAAEATRMLDAIRTTELPLLLLFNRGRVMALHPGVSKATGLQAALDLLRLSPRNAVAIGNGENDHDLLRLAEVGVAVEWATPALRAASDLVIAGTGPDAVAEFIRNVAAGGRIPAVPRFRRRLRLGHTDDGTEFRLLASPRNVLITGDAKSGKSWIAGLLFEELVAQGYCVCAIDPEGDYRSLERLPRVTVLGGDAAPPTPHQLFCTLRYPDRSVVLDLSHRAWEQRIPYVRAVLAGLKIMRRRTGLPHGILLDQAHHVIGDEDASGLFDLESNGYIVVTSSASRLPTELLATVQEIIATCVSNPEEVDALRHRCASRGANNIVPWPTLRTLKVGQAVVLPLAKEVKEAPRLLTVRQRMTPHVRHLEKYVDFPAADPNAFQFDVNFHLPHRAATLREFVTALAGASIRTLDGYLRRGDFSRWIADVLGDRTLARELRAIEKRHSATADVDTVEAIIEAIRGRYDLRDDVDGAIGQPVDQVPVATGT